MAQYIFSWSENMTVVFFHRPKSRHRLLRRVVDKCMKEKWVQKEEGLDAFEVFINNFLDETEE